MIAAFLRAMRGQPPRATTSRDPDEDSPAFVRGLALGALVGAAIAGSTVWQRRQARLAKDHALAADGSATVERTAPAPR